jgi:hypothetical protein
LTFAAEPSNETSVWTSSSPAQRSRLRPRATPSRDKLSAGVVGDPITMAALHAASPAGQLDAMRCDPIPCMRSTSRSGWKHMPPGSSAAVGIGHKEGRGRPESPRLTNRAGQRVPVWNGTGTIGTTRLFV